MALPEPSSVVSSIQELLKTESRRVQAEDAERQELALEHEKKLSGNGPRVSGSSGGPLMLTATLVTLLLGAIGSWVFVILPGEQRADAAYTSLRDTYTSLLHEQQQRADAWSRERRQLKSEIESALKELSSFKQIAERGNDPTWPNNKPNGPPRQPHVGSRPGVMVHPCTCLKGDPLCDC